MVIDPAARRTDGESVRIAKDVLCAGAQTKICLPDGPDEVERALARRGARRPVVVGDDRALLRVVELLHRRRELADATLSVVPVGGPATVALARSLGVPTDPVTAARTVLDGAAHPRDLLVDDSGGVVLGGLRIPSGPRTDPAVRPGGPDAYDPYAAGAAPPPETGPPNGSGTASGGANGHRDGRAAEPGPASGGSRPGGGSPAWWTPAARTARTALTLLSLPVIGLTGGSRRRVHPPPPHRLRIEADGVLLSDLDRPVTRVSVSTAGPGDGGLAEIVVHPHAAGGPVRALARAVTVSGQDFRYRADALVRGPVRSRTWTVLTEAWTLIVPHPT
ncbi:hypothetical protein [Streptomyces sp. NA02950]|uniref:hypothetical protein n=1 Tax=Streptomyces sp. NA02950 TaxID=2742137 RepID=UPI001C3793BD|nr:hypothetical protein [Streptomyces sp. NA02950]